MVQVLLKVVDVLAMDDAIKCMQEAHESGVAFVTGDSTACCPVLFMKGVRCRSRAYHMRLRDHSNDPTVPGSAACAQEDAEKYCQGLRNNGLTATIEPDTGSGGGLN